MAKAPVKKAAKEKRSAPLAFRVRPSLKSAIADAAEADRRSVSAMIEVLLEEILKAKGFLK